MSSPPPAEPGEPRRRAGWVVVAWVAVMAAHGAAVWYVLPPRFALDERPILFADYVHHLRSCLLSAQLPAPHRWVYDPFQMAGFPANTRDAVANHGVALVVAALGGSHPVATYKLFILVAFFLIPAVVGIAWWALGGRAEEAVAAAWLTSLVWAIDPGFRLFREFGGFSFPIGSAMSLLALALLHRFLTRRSWGSLAAGLVIAALAMWVHVAAIMLLAGAVIVLLVARPRQAGWRRLAVVLPFLLVPVLGAWSWLEPLRENGRWLAPTSERLGALGIGELVRMLTFAPGARLQSSVVWLGVAGLWVLGRRRPRLAVWLALSALPLLIVAFVPVLELVGLRFLQPQRFLVTALLWLAAPAVVAASAFLARLGRAARLGVASATVLVLTAYQQLPWLQVATASPTRMASLLDRTTLPPEVDRLGRWVLSRPPGGQVLLEDASSGAAAPYGGAPIGGLLSLTHRRPILGGPLGLPLQQQAVELIEGQWLGEPFAAQPTARLRERLGRYAVAWFVAVRPDTVRLLDATPDVVTPTERWGPFATYMVREPKPFADGAEAVELAFGRIAVRGAGLPHTLVRLHWHQRVRCTPALAVERLVFADDPVGLMRVHNGSVRDFVLTFDSPAPAP